jgi:hypothetical protein
LGNLADELDQLDDEDEFDEGVTEETPHCEGEVEEQSRDSGIDVSYAHADKSRAPTHVRNFSKPFGGSDGGKPPDAMVFGDEEPGPLHLAPAEGDDKFSADLEGLMNTVARMTTNTATTGDDPLIPRAIAQLQDLGNQTTLEAAAHRYTTVTNSLTSHLNAQAKVLQTLAQSMYPMFAGFAAAPWDPALIDETLPLLDLLKDDIPHADLLPVQKLQKLDRETADVISTLSQLTDTLQMGKQTTNSAARHLRTTQTMVVELRQERERAELARHELERTNWDERLQSRWCGGECRDIISGFEDRCNSLRGSLEASLHAGT